MRAHEFITEKWTKKYKKSINCSSPKGFSQKAHCAGRKKNEDVAEEGYGDHPSQRVDPRTGKKLVPPKSPLKQGVTEGSESDAYGNTGEKHECGSCDGTGIDTHDDECPECGGKGWVRDKESSKKKGVAEGLDEDLRKWFKDKWVRFGPDGKIRGDCARGSEKEGKPKCLPQSKAQALGKKGRATAAARKRREDPNANRSGKAINVKTK